MKTNKEIAKRFPETLEIATNFRDEAAELHRLVRIWSSHYQKELDQKDQEIARLTLELNKWKSGVIPED